MFYQISFCKNNRGKSLIYKLNAPAKYWRRTPLLSWRNPLLRVLHLRRTTSPPRPSSLASCSRATPTPSVGTAGSCENQICLKLNSIRALLIIQYQMTVYSLHYVDFKLIFNGKMPRKDLFCTFLYRFLNSIKLGKSIVTCFEQLLLADCLVSVVSVIWDVFQKILVQRSRRREGR